MSLLHETASMLSLFLFHATHSISPNEAILITGFDDDSEFHISKLLSIEVDAIQFRLCGDHLASLLVRCRNFLLY